MSTPTDQQQIRATLRRLIRTHGVETGIAVMLSAGSDVVPSGGPERIIEVAEDLWGFRRADGDGQLPPLLGAAEAADLLGMKATNLKRLSPPLPVAAVVSGRIPIYRLSDVQEAKARRDARRAA